MVPNPRLKGDRKDKGIPRVGQKSQVPFGFQRPGSKTEPKLNSLVVPLNDETSCEHSKEESATHLVSRCLCVLCCSLGGFGVELPLSGKIKENIAWAWFHGGGYPAPPF